MLSSRRRYRLTIEYDGCPFVGWQRQNTGQSVQGVLEEALLSLTGTAKSVVAAGRTDSGVHALGQSAHVDLERVWPERQLMRALNAHIGQLQPVAVIAVRAVGNDFHARFDAVRRTYLYRLSDRTVRPVLQKGRVWHPKCSSALDVAAMERAAAVLVGHHDFTTFRDAACQARSPMRTLDSVSIERHGEEVEIEFVARSFLHRQVRSMVGSLVEVGRGRWPERHIADILAAADRTSCGPVAPPDGLYLVGVDYADDELG